MVKLQNIIIEIRADNKLGLVISIKLFYSSCKSINMGRLQFTGEWAWSDFFFRYPQGTCIFKLFVLVLIMAFSHSNQYIIFNHLIYFGRTKSNWTYALSWCRCTTGKHTTEKPVTKAVSANRPKATPVQSSKQTVGADACARCRQGFFCSDHGEFVFTVALFRFSLVLSIYGC